MTTSGRKQWDLAKQIIPGGNQLLSKRPERFLPEQWPTYYSRAKGCEVWDLDGRHFYDFAQMGVGTCGLGYADDFVNSRVKQAIDNGSMCSLNCIEEVQLAQKLIELHPWAGMARFTRSGGEACTVAVRIARAYTKKDLVLFCGYHGWHDWYLSSNISDPSNLNKQLLTGLEPKGVPNSLNNTALPFNYNNKDEIDDLVNKHGDRVGVIIMECMRDTGPIPGFLEHVRKIATKLDAVLIIDEITSGFRGNLGGIHLEMGLEPDVAVFGKALGNGHPIGAIVGKSKIMDFAQETFISSTAWTERVGFVAAIATIQKMQEQKVPEKLNYFGRKLKEGWTRIALEKELDVSIVGNDATPRLTFNYPNANAIQTLHAQNMLAKGYLVGAALYMTYAYTDKIIERFLAESACSFENIKKALHENSVEDQLEGPEISFDFKRLT